MTRIEFLPDGAHCSLHMPSSSHCKIQRTHGCHCSYMVLKSFLSTIKSYVFYKETSLGYPQVNDDDINSHKQFLIQIINSFIHRAKNEDTKCSITRQTIPVGQVEPVTLYISTELNNYVLAGQTHHLKPFDHARFIPGEHKLITRKQIKCKYCQYLVGVARVKREPLPIEERSTQECRIFEVSLCKNHKD